MEGVGAELALLHDLYNKHVYTPVVFSDCCGPRIDYKACACGRILGDGAGSGYGAGSGSGAGSGYGAGNGDGAGDGYGNGDGARAR